MSLLLRFVRILGAAPEPGPSASELAVLRTARATVTLMRDRWHDGSNRVLGRAVVTEYGHELDLHATERWED